MRVLYMTCFGAIGAFGWMVWQGVDPGTQYEIIEGALEADAAGVREAVVSRATEVGDQAIDAAVDAVEQGIADATAAAAEDARASLRESLRGSLERSLSPSADARTAASPSTL